MKKVFEWLAAVIFAVVLLSAHSMISAAADYQDYDGKVLSTGAIFVYGDYSYRVLKPATIKKYHGIEVMKSGEVELVGYNPHREYPKSVTYYTKKYLSEHVTVDSDLIYGGYWEYDLVGIADNAFKNNQKIKEVLINAEGLKYIGKSAFEGCRNLLEITIIDTGITKIKTRAFYGCKSLKEVFLENDKLTKVGKDAFSNTNSKIKLGSYSMTQEHVSKLKKAFTRAGIKKVYFKRSHLKD